MSRAKRPKVCPGGVNTFQFSATSPGLGKYVLVLFILSTRFQPEGFETSLPGILLPLDTGLSQAGPGYLNHSLFHPAPAASTRLSFSLPISSSIPFAFLICCFRKPFASHSMTTVSASSRTSHRLTVRTALRSFGWLGAIARKSCVPDSARPASAIRAASRGAVPTSGCAGGGLKAHCGPESGTGTPCREQSVGSETLRAPAPPTTPVCRLPERSSAPPETFLPRCLEWVRKSTTCPKACARIGAGSPLVYGCPRR